MQAKVPFDRDTVEYIMGLDSSSDLAMLAECGVHVRPACARIFKAATVVLKKVAARGLSPRDAADILERNTLRKSTMEKMHRCVSALPAICLHDCLLPPCGCSGVSGAAWTAASACVAV